MAKIGDIAGNNELKPIESVPGVFLAPLTSADVRELAKHGAEVMARTKDGSGDDDSDPAVVESNMDAFEAHALHLFTRPVVVGEDGTKFEDAQDMKGVRDLRYDFLRRIMAGVNEALRDLPGKS